MYTAPGTGDALGDTAPYMSIRVSLHVSLYVFLTGDALGDTARYSQAVAAYQRAIQSAALATGIGFIGFGV